MINLIVLKYTIYSFKYFNEKLVYVQELGDWSGFSFQSS